MYVSFIIVNGQVSRILEPTVLATLVAPDWAVGRLLELCASRRGEQLEHTLLPGSGAAAGPAAGGPAAEASAAEASGPVGPAGPGPAADAPADAAAVGPFCGPLRDVLRWGAAPSRLDSSHATPLHQRWLTRIILYMRHSNTVHTSCGTEAASDRSCRALSFTGLERLARAAALPPAAGGAGVGLLLRRQGRLAGVR
jgi:hypothetical protein